MGNIDKVIDTFIAGDYFIIFLILMLIILVVLILALIKSRQDYNEILNMEIKNKKELANLAKRTGDDELRRETQERINQLTRKYHKFSEASGLPTKMERASVSGFRAVKRKTRVDNSLKNDIINLNRESDTKQFKPLDAKIRERMFTGLRRNGADIIIGPQAEEYLDYKSKIEKTYIEATSIGNVMMFRKNPSASAVFEETIHFYQYKQGRTSTDLQILDELEIEAAEKMIKNQKAYHITDEEIVYTKKRLKILRRRN